MLRKIIRIDEEKCNGCGACAKACHEGAIQMADGKAKLVFEDYCDGLGDCLPVCPTDAISFEERDVPAYTKKTVHPANLPCGCPGTESKVIRREDTCMADAPSPITSRLSQWPVQIKLVSVKAACFDGADLLIAADCTAYAYGNFHNEFIRDRIVLVGCPKLDAVDYTEKLTAIITNNTIKSLTVVRMEVPCCGGLEAAAKNALKASGKVIPLQVVTISTDGRIIA